jgi:uncharacterized membrane protein YraQ (UPF0718 family)
VTTRTGESPGQQHRATKDGARVPERRRWRPNALEVVVIVGLVLILGRAWLQALFAQPALQTASTVFVAIILQATPFLVLGVLLSAAITAFVPSSFWTRALPSRTSLAVPVAGMAGCLLPGCECASVPVAGSLMSKGVAPAASLAFLLSAPAINPIVIVSTLVAFPGQPLMAAARFIASLLTAVIMGWLWLRFGKSDWLRIADRGHLHGSTKGETFRLTASHDFLHAGGFLVIGALAAAVMNVAMPTAWMQAIADHAVISVIVLALLAVVLSICSEADAFVAASFTSFSLTARLAFLVVGPMVDLKLFSLQVGTFGRSFAIRFAPTTFAVAVIMSCAIGWWLLS